MPSPLPAATALALVVAGCGPIYETTYSYTPPGTPEGMVCAGRCRSVADACARNCRLRRDALRWAEVRQNRPGPVGPLLDQRWSDPVIRGGLPDAAAPSTCRMPDPAEPVVPTAATGCEASCRDRYNICYTGCGGTVTPATRCVAFCG